MENFLEIFRRTGKIYLTHNHHHCHRLISKDDDDSYELNICFRKCRPKTSVFTFFVWSSASVPCGIVPVAGVTSQQHLRSAAQWLLVVPRHQLSSYGRRAFCVAGLSVWNSLPDNLRNQIIGRNSFRQSLKTFLFATY